MASNQEYVYQALKGAGLPPVGIAGVMGNIQVESGFDPSRQNSGEGAIGLAQWEGSRRTALQAFAASRSKSESDLDTQIMFLIQEAKNRGNWDAMSKMTDARQAAAYWDSAFEVSSGSSRGERESLAEQFFNSDFKNLPGLNQFASLGGSLNPLNWIESIKGIFESINDVIKFISERRVRILEGGLGVSMIAFAAIKVTNIEKSITQMVG